ncbi:uncharacterized protein VNE69_05112 [Vairimorpha necatrix]|uniref:Uncharacterized protein n=1 Tax=Vairimorpha necatrix TaxID=6039 RepID=A0AAX4JC35_9MICR
MGNKTKSKQKKNKKSLNKEHEYKGDINNFDDFAAFYRRRNRMMSNPIPQSTKKDDLYMECTDEYNTYYNNILYLGKKKSPLRILSELAYLDYYRNNLVKEEEFEKRICVFGHKGCKKKECWVEKCRNCSDKACPTCASNKVNIINEYFSANDDDDLDIEHYKKRHLD